VNTTATVREIAAQVSALCPDLKTRFIQMDDKTLRVNRKTRRGVRNVDISYNPVFDLYDVTVYQFGKNITGLYEQTVEECVYGTDLRQYIHGDID